MVIELHINKIQNAASKTIKEIELKANEPIINFSINEAPSD